MTITHANIFNFTAVNLGTCYMFSKQITHDGLGKEQGMLGRNRQLLILQHTCMPLVLDDLRN
jgi:hypothetical protein